MQWWMWIIAIAMIVAGVAGIIEAFVEDEPFHFVLGAAVITVAVFGTIWFKHWEPQQHRDHLQAIADTRQQGIVTKSVVDETFDVGALAGNCIIPMERHKVAGTYRLEILLRVKLPHGASAVVKAPVDKQFLDAIGKLPPCK